jgi:hypothetical protein
MRFFVGVIEPVIVLSLASPALAAPTAKHPPHKRHYSNNGSVPGYGFLPGVRTPRQIER